MLDALRKPANIATAVWFVLIPVLGVFAFLGKGLFPAPRAQKPDPSEALRRE